MDNRRLYADAPRLPAGETVDVRRLLLAEPDRIEIEIGPGRGGFMVERLAARPDVGMIGFEIKRKWAKIVDDRLAGLGYFGRARVFAEDAREALARLGPDGCVQAFFLNFPDPWWKKRHFKRLVVCSHFLTAIARLLGPGGELFIQTDVEERASGYDALVRAHPAFELLGDSPGSANVETNPYLATSHRERRAVSDAIPIQRLRFARRPNRDCGAGASNGALAGR
jgi:tRNA (guanine-N7-)-methyltransferase